MEFDDIKLGIGLPLVDQKVYVHFLDSFVRLQKPDNWVYLRPEFPSLNIASVRNAIVRQAQENGVTHLLMMDTDQTYEPNIIGNLLGDMVKNDIMVLGGRVHRRYPPYDPILYKLDKELNKYYLVDDKEWSQNELVEVEATGGGCLLINMELFDKIEYPWFKEVPAEESDTGTVIGEDIYFCKKVREKEIKIFVNTKVKIGHLGLMEVNEHFYFLNKMLDEMREQQIRKNMEV